MRVTSSTVADNFLYNLGKVTDRQMQAYQQVSTGQRITNPSDDPAAMATILGLNDNQRSITQYTANINRATNINEVSTSNVNTIKSAVVRAGELGAGVDSLTDSTSFSAKALELNQLIEQAVQNGNAQFDGQYLFGGNTTDTAPFTVARDASGNITAVTYAGSTSSSSIEISNNVSVSPYSTPTQNQELADTMNHLIAMRDAMTAKDVTAVTAARTNVAGDEDKVINQISNYGATLSRIEWATKQNTTESTAITNRVSGLADVDLATATVRYNQMQNAYQAAIAAGSKMMSVSLLNYLT